jgi:hypothetical protein
LTPEAQQRPIPVVGVISALSREAQASDALCHWLEAIGYSEGRIIAVRWNVAARAG